MDMSSETVHMSYVTYFAGTTMHEKQKKKKTLTWLSDR
jgi:hypothetical protein